MWPTICSLYSQEIQMKKTKAKTTVRNMIPKHKTAIVGSTAGIAVAGAAVAGLAGYFLWRNRESIFNFVGQYVDLPEALDFSDSESDESSMSPVRSGSKSSSLGASSQSL
jgi:hypothetical protein